MAEDLKKKDKNKTFEGNALKRLSERQRKELLSRRREQKQVASFLMPDAPPKKSRKVSPERLPCPLLPGTLEVPPPRVPQSWEKTGTPLEASHQPHTPVPGTPPSKTCSMPVLTLSTGVIKVDDISGMNVCEVDIELKGCWPSNKPGPSSAILAAPETRLPETRLSTPSSSWPKPFADQSIELELALDNPGSDVEVDLGDEAVSTNRIHFTRECPTVEDLSPEALNIVNSMDQLDDIALKQMASEDMLDFSWSSDPSVFTGQREIFTGQPGPTFEVDGMSPFKIFSMIWDADIMSLIVRETNTYGEQIKNDPRTKTRANIKQWTPITETELWIFFAILMGQSLIPVPVELEYWRPKALYLKVGHFEDMMSLNRFRLVKKCLHFVNNSELATSTNTPSKITKILPIINHLNEKFSSLYLPGQEIAIDESLLLWKGRLSFAQLINTKAARVGIKSYELCESKTGYLWRMLIYAGKKKDVAESVEGDDAREVEPEGTTSKIVYDLVRPLLYLGHSLVMDNFYNSPLLSRTLKNRKTDTMGTLRLNRKFVPKSLQGKNKNNMRTGEVCFSQTKDITIVVWKDSNVVSLISTFHNVEVGAKEKYGYYRYRPKVVLDYNLYMGGVDKKDQLLQAYPIERIRNAVWYKKLFRRLLNISILNSHVIFGTRTNMSSREFRFQLMNEILGRFRPTALRPLPTTTTGHFPAKTGKRKSRCKLCASHKRDVCTTWKCEECQVNLCLPECFKAFHLNQMS